MSSVLPEPSTSPTAREPGMKAFLKKTLCSLIGCKYAVQHVDIKHNKIVVTGVGKCCRCGR
jgi:hypothetical protein